MAGSADADLSGLERQPVALAHHTLSSAVGELPGESPPGRNERGDRAVCRETNTPLRSAGDRVARLRIMQNRRQHPPAGPRLVDPAQAAQQISLKDLQMADGVDLAGRAGGARAAAGHLEIEWLLAVRLVARGDVAAHHHGETAGPQPG